MSKKTPYAVLNQSSGYDLMVERDSGNMVRILTGNEEMSQEFWEQLKDLAENVLEEMDYEVAKSETVYP